MESPTKGSRYRITVQRNTLANSPQKGAVRFTTGQILEGTFETQTTAGELCYRLDGMDAFVFFPPGSIGYEQIEEPLSDLAKEAVAKQRQLDLEDPREWATKLAKDIADADD